MLHDARDPFSAKKGKLHGVVGIKEQVGPVGVFKRAIGMHPGSVDSGDGFRHERREIAVLPRDNLDDLLEGLHVVAGLEDVGEAEIDFLLASRHLVMGSLNHEAELLEFHRDIPTNRRGPVHRGQIEIGSAVDWFEGRRPFLVQLEEEEFRLEANREGVDPIIVERLDLLFEDITRITGEWLAIGSVDIANESGDPAIGIVFEPQDHPGIEVRTQKHVRFFDTDEPLDG